MLAALQRAGMVRPVGQLVAVADDDPRAAVGETEIELLVGDAPRERHEDGACPLGRPVEERGVEAVVEHHRKTLAGLEVESPASCRVRTSSSP